MNRSVPIIASNPRRDAELKKELALEKKRKKCVGHPLPSDIRYNERSSAERATAT